MIRESDGNRMTGEGNNNLHRTVQRVKALGKRVGVVINPAAPASVLEEILQDVDQVLVMTVNPGFGHHHVIDRTLPKIRHVRQTMDEIERHYAEPLPSCGRGGRRCFCRAITGDRDLRPKKLRQRSEVKHENHVLV
jgi:hypothetical protein